MEGNIRSLTLIGSGTTATAFAGRIASGAVNQIIVTDRGEKYNYPPTVAISSAPSGGTRATGLSTLRDDIVNCDGTLIGSKVQGVFITNPGAGYIVNPGIVFVGVNTNPGVGAAATTRISDNTVGVVTISDAGGGYVSAPTVTFSSPGIGTTAQGVAVVSTAGTVTAIYLTHAGAGYTVAPTITLSAPDLGGSGNFIPTETITGGSSGVTGIVKTWNATTNILTYSNVSGDFVAGETITGSESGASYTIRVVEDDNTVNKYPDNDEIELSAKDGIIDFSESNPFGNP